MSLHIAYVMQNVGVDMASQVGQAILIRHTIEGLEKAGHQVSLFSLQGRTVHRVDDLTHLENVHLAPLGMSGKRPFLLTESAVRRLQGMLHLPYLALFDSYRFYEANLRLLPAFQVCHEYAGLLSVGAAYACKRLRKPYVLTVDADLLLERAAVGQPLRGVQATMAKWAARTSYRLADKIVCVSQPAKQNLVQNWGVDGRKIVIIPNGVNVEQFSKTADSAAIRAQLAIHPDAPVIMFVGGFQFWHGLDRLLESFAQVLKDTPLAQLVLVGDGPARASVEQQAQQLGIVNNLHITGMVAHTRVPELLTIADVVTIPYPRLPKEMWFSPLKLYEYMAAGKTIVASAEGQIQEVIENGRNGLLVPPGDVDSLAQAIIHLLHNPAERAQLGRNARQQAVERHSWDGHIQQLVETYLSVL